MAPGARLANVFVLAAVVSGSVDTFDRTAFIINLARYLGEGVTEDDITLTLSAASVRVEATILSLESATALASLNSKLVTLTTNASVTSAALLVPVQSVNPLVVTTRAVVASQSPPHTSPPSIEPPLALHSSPPTLPATSSALSDPGGGGSGGVVIAFVIISVIALMIGVWWRIRSRRRAGSQTKHPVSGPGPPMPLPIQAPVALPVPVQIPGGMLVAAPTPVVTPDETPALPYERFSMASSPAEVPAPLSGQMQTTKPALDATSERETDEGDRSASDEDPTHAGLASLTDRLRSSFIAITAFAHQSATGLLPGIDEFQQDDEFVQDPAQAASSTEETTGADLNATVDVEASGLARPLPAGLPADEELADKAPATTVLLPPLDRAMKEEVGEGSGSGQPVDEEPKREVLMARHTLSEHEYFLVLATKVETGKLEA